jgi:hypothetical protein
MHQIDSGIKENFFRWNGRLNRKRFIMRLLALTGVGIVLYILMGVLLVVYADGTMRPSEETIMGIYGLCTLLSIPITVASYMLMIRRLHDVGLSGYFILLAFIPFVSLGLLLYLLCKHGTEGDNAYGADPLGTVCAAPEPANPYARGAYTDTPTDIQPSAEPRD